MTLLKECKCQHVYQDKKYGKNVRVHNTCGKDKARCTVCLNEKVLNVAAK